jgi:hypothetical protein
MMARGNWARSAATRASSVAASGCGPSITVTEVVSVAMAAPFPTLGYAGSSRSWRGRVGLSTGTGYRFEKQASQKPFGAGPLEDG